MAVSYNYKATAWRIFEVKIGEGSHVVLHLTPAFGNPNLNYIFVYSSALPYVDLSA